MNRTFRITMDLVFEDDGDECYDDEIKELTVKQIKDTVNAGLQSEASYDLFGESLSIAGLLTPEIGSIEEIK